MVLQSNRLEDLRSLVLDWLFQHPLAPLEQEVMLVQSDGVAQWLKMAMAGDRSAKTKNQGQQTADDWQIAFGINVMLPARFQWLAYKSVLGQTMALPERTPFDRNRLKWMLFRQIPRVVSQPVYQPLQQYLANDRNSQKLWQLCCRLADLYDEYQIYRADWLQNWMTADELISPLGESVSIPAEQLWQSALWRDLLSSVEPQLRQTHRAAVHDQFIDAARNLVKLPPGLPRRLVVFGISAMPKQTLEALAALSGVTQIMLCMLNPCRHYWGDLVEDRQLLKGEYRRQPKRQSMPTSLTEENFHQYAHPLLAAWGKQGRDYLHLIDVHDETNNYAHLFKSAGLQIDVFSEPDENSLLGQLQDDILELRSVDESKAHWPPVNANDKSIQFHVTHSGQREVEILHDQLLHAFSMDPDLMPSDIIVMVPEVEEFAPQIHAVFGQFEKNQSRHIPYQIADRRQRHVAPLLIAVEQLLKLPQLRLKVSEVMEILMVPAVSKKFGLEAADLPLLSDWIEAANIRWGLDGKHRQLLGLPTLDGFNSWRFGLQRMLYGYALGDLDPEIMPVDNIVPLPTVSGLGAEIVGPLEAFLFEIGQFLEDLQVDRTPAEWVEVLQRLLDTFFADTDIEEDRLLGQLRNALDDWIEETEAVSFEERVPLNIVREVWLDKVDDTGLSQRFGGGAVTFATLLPMRAIPFKWVCLLGMNDSSFPRKNTSPDFDLMSRVDQYRPGDRSRREDDRYLFLEAILAAREQLYVSWSGRSQVDNTEQPPSVVVSQLCDHLNAAWKAPIDRAGEVVTNLTLLHKLQPFSAAYFSVDTPNLFTYAVEWQQIETEKKQENEKEGTGKDRSTSPTNSLSSLERESPLDFRELTEFLKNPVKELYRQRFGVTFRSVDEEYLDDESFGIAPGLDRWQQQHELLHPIGEKLLSQPGLDIEFEMSQLILQRWKAGHYSPGQLGLLQGKQLAAPLVGSLGELQRLMSEFSSPLTPGLLFEFELDNLAVEDVIDAVWKRPDGKVSRLVLDASRTQHGQFDRLSIALRYWPAHLALQINSGSSYTNVVGADAVMTLGALDKYRAMELMQKLLSYWREGMMTPIPLTAALAEAVLYKCKGNTSELDTLQFSEAVTAYEHAGGAFTKEFPDSAALLDHTLFRSMLEDIYLPLFSLLQESR